MQEKESGECGFPVKKRGGGPAGMNEAVRRVVFSGGKRWKERGKAPSCGFPGFFFSKHHGRTFIPGVPNSPILVVVTLGERKGGAPLRRKEGGSAVQPERD